MKSGWRIILTVVVLAILLGAICTGVGLLTGANPDRILQSLNQDYHLASYLELCRNYINLLSSTFHSLI